MQWCQTQILPMIKEANISYNLIQTGNAKAVDLRRWLLYVQNTPVSPVKSFCASQNAKTTPGS